MPLFGSFVTLSNRPLGFDTDRVATGQLTPPRGTYGAELIKAGMWMRCSRSCEPRLA
jgi:hypothetical protein